MTRRAAPMGQELQVDERMPYCFSFARIWGNFRDGSFLDTTRLLKELQGLSLELVPIERRRVHGPF